jgi:N-carbamoyl-L-amino-acid hydrolase
MTSTLKKTVAEDRASSAIRETITRFLTRVNAISAGGPGWTRPSYSDLESQAHAVAEDEARMLGLEISRDAAGNLFARMAGRDPSQPQLYTGSHLDTVSEGGRL